AYALSSSFYNYTFRVRVLRSGDWADLVFTVSLGLGALLAASWRKGHEVDEPEASRPGVASIDRRTEATKSVYAGPQRRRDGPISGRCV
ncbi:MAG: hypothetical protein ACRDGI_06070, partial [Candidatus Limnocylindrales bacterium]